MFKITYKINFILSFTKPLSKLSNFVLQICVLNANHQLLLDIAFYSIVKTITIHANF